MSRKKKTKIMDEPNSVIIHIKMDRRKCIACREKAYGRQLTEGEWSLAFSIDGWWPIHDIRQHDGMMGQGTCPTKRIMDYYTPIKAKATAALKEHLPENEFRALRPLDIRCHNKFYCHQDPPEWCLFKKEHADWAKLRNKKFVVPVGRYA